ncbi:hypothetical protein ABP1_1199 [Bacillus subtilis]|nr:hypothetical protein ABP1_1199 [Bacillus subtilis]
MQLGLNPIYASPYLIFLHPLLFVSVFIIYDFRLFLNYFCLFLFLIKKKAADMPLSRFIMIQF